MAEGNGELPPSTTTTPITTTTTTNNSTSNDGNAEKSADHRRLLECGVDARVADRLDAIYRTGKLAHADLDDRALDALKEFPVEGALSVLAQFLDSNLEHVSNKSAYLCGVMKTYRQKSRTSGGGTGSAGGSQGSGGGGGGTGVGVKGPDEEKIREILERTGYTLDVTTGQRKYGGPPPGWDSTTSSSTTPGAGCEVFCGKIPKDMYEDELIPLFEQCGTIWDLRLMMDPMTGTNRGYAFVTFTNREGAQNAVQKLDNHEMKPGRPALKVNVSVPNLRLFVGNIPKSKGREEIAEEFGKLTAGLTEVIIYSSPDDKKKNRGFCFLEYDSHKSASLAKRRLGTGRIKVWGCDIIVDWADPQEEPDEQTMAKVKVLYVRNLTQEVTEERLKECFERSVAGGGGTSGGSGGKVERVKKIKDYAFVHFEDREHAVKAMEELDGKEVGGSNIEVSLAKPPSDKKKKEEILRARERRMFQMLQVRGGMMPAAALRGCPPGGAPGGPSSAVGGGGGGGGGGRQAGRMGGGGGGGPMGRGDYDYDYDCYGGDCYRGGYSDPYYDDHHHHHGDPYLQQDMQQMAPPQDDYYYGPHQCDHHSHQHMPPPPPPPLPPLPPHHHHHHHHHHVMTSGGGGGGGGVMMSSRGGGRSRMNPMAATATTTVGRGRGAAAAAGAARGRAGGGPQARGVTTVTMATTTTRGRPGPQQQQQPFTTTTTTTNQQQPHLQQQQHQGGRGAVGVSRVAGGVRGAAAAVQGVRARASLPGKRKFDGGHYHHGNNNNTTGGGTGGGAGVGDTKRRYGNWGGNNRPSPSNNNNNGGGGGSGGGGGDNWYSQQQWS